LKADKAIYGEVKGIIYQAIILNQRFTVSELCAYTNLEPERIYPVLAKLRRDRVLMAKPIPALRAKAKRAAHRPGLVYWLSDDPEKRKRLTDQIAPFLRLSQARTASSPALQRASESNTRLSAELGRLESLARVRGPLSLDDLTSIDKELKEVGEDLQIAFYHARHVAGSPLETDAQDELRRVEELSARLSSLLQLVRTESEEICAEKQIMDLLVDLERNLQPQSGEHGKVAATAAIRWLTREYSHCSDPFLKSMLSRVAAKVTLFERMQTGLTLPVPPPPLALILAQSCLQFGSQANWPCQVTESVASKERRKDFATIYNLLNLRLLTGQAKKARELWSSLISAEDAAERDAVAALLRGSMQLTVYGSTLLTYGDPAALGRDELIRLQDQLGLDGALSATALVQIPAFGRRSYVLKPTLMDWLEPVHGFILSNSIGQGQPDVFAYGPLADGICFPGLASVRLAIALVRLGVSIEQSWGLASSLKQGKGLLLLHAMSSSVFSDLTLPEGFERLPVDEVAFTPVRRVA